MANKSKLFKPKLFLLDVDGVLTNGQFFYSSEGKILKIFGPDDNDALSLVRNFIDVKFITGDRKGFEISYKRIVDDMKLSLDLVSTVKRIDWITERYNPLDIIYMGDGIFDHYVMKKVGYSIAPANADKMAKRHADFVTERLGGDRAVSEACLHILDKFFEAYNPNELLKLPKKGNGEWGI